MQDGPVWVTSDLYTSACLASINWLCDLRVLLIEWNPGAILDNMINQYRVLKQKFANVCLLIRLPKCFLKWVLIWNYCQTIDITVYIYTYTYKCMYELQLLGFSSLSGISFYNSPTFFRFVGIVLNYLLRLLTLSSRYQVGQCRDLRLSSETRLIYIIAACYYFCSWTTVFVLRFNWVVICPIWLRRI